MPAIVLVGKNEGKGTKVRVCDCSISEDVLLFAGLHTIHFHRMLTNTTSMKSETAYDLVYQHICSRWPEKNCYVPIRDDIHDKI
jgi:hypothetical protein